MDIDILGRQVADLQNRVNALDGGRAPAALTSDQQIERDAKEEASDDQILQAITSLAREADARLTAIEERLSALEADDDDDEEIEQPDPQKSQEQAPPADPNKPAPAEG